jgi:hypothetical protein
MEILIGILGIIVGLIIAVIPYFWSKYYVRPELTLEIVSDGGISSPQGLSNKNDFTKGAIEAETAIRIFELTWKFNVVIRNNSDLIAFYPEIEFNPKGPKFTQLDKLNKLQPIKPAESLILKAEYRKFEESTGKNRTQIGRTPPSEFSDLGILVGYENSKKRRFYSLFNYSMVDNKNIFLRGKPKDYKNN